jgi:hypothetical protein
MDTGGGHVTICDIVIRPAAAISIEVEPLPEEEVGASGRCQRDQSGWLRRVSPRLQDLRSALACINWT